MNGNMRTHVEELLRTYHRREREIAVRKFELSNFTGISEGEQIGAITFGRGEGSFRAPGHISNKTLHIALNYQEQTSRVNSEALHEIADELAKLELEQRRLCYYVSLLEKRHAQVLELIFFEGLTKEAAAKKMGLAPRTIQQTQKQAIDALTELYSDLRGLQR